MNVIITVFGFYKVWRNKKTLFALFAEIFFHFLLSFSDASLYEGIVRPIIYYHELFNLISKSLNGGGEHGMILADRNKFNTHDLSWRL